MQERQDTMKYSLRRTDLALETRELLREECADDEISGVEITVEEDEDKGIVVTWVNISNEQGAAAMGKPVGNYVTIESQAMKENDTAAHENIAKILARKLGRLHNLKRDAVVLVAGLGNWNITPDALGPKVCAKILVTRHMGSETPQELEGKVRRVSALSPGVMGLTGIETGEIIKGVVEKVQPDLVIAIDALAARRTSRINATVQMTDTGISPGAGMGNKRMSLNKESLGVPVIAIGVPTVVDAATLVNDTMDRMLTAMAEAVPAELSDSKNAAGTETFFNMLRELKGEEKYGLIKELLDPYAGNMFVTPKEVDAVINRLSNLIANALNIALHPGITTDDVNRYLL